MTRKAIFFQGSPWFKFKNLGLALVMALKTYTNMVKGLKLNVRIFQALIPAFVEVTEEKLAGGAF